MTGPVRAAAYCRVSTDHEDQAGSLASQRAYFTQYIAQHPGWTLAEVYADEGVSGTSTRRRRAFARMMADAEAGRLDLILTKEVSRFARNTVDTLACTRRLLALGVGVVFLTDHIDTRDSDGELRLTLMASIAQEESRKTSQRVKWGQRRRMEAGVVFGGVPAYGYCLDAGRLLPHEPEAAVVRRLFSACLREGLGTYVLARRLTEAGVPPPRRTDGLWTPATLRRILRNPIYAGDLLQNKTVTTDYLTHHRQENRGQFPQLLLRDHHPALVPRPQWEAVQRELDRRAALSACKSRHSAAHWCSGRLFCARCGQPLRPKTYRYPDRESCCIWVCKGRCTPAGPACTAPALHHRTLNACCSALLRALLPDPAPLLRLFSSFFDAYIKEEGTHTEERSPLLAARDRLDRRERRAVSGFADGLLSPEELSSLRDQVRRDREALDRRLAALSSQESWSLPGRDRLKQLLFTSEAVLGAVVETVTAGDGVLDVTLRELGTCSVRFHTLGRGQGRTVHIDGITGAARPPTQEGLHWPPPAPPVQSSPGAPDPDPLPAPPSPGPPDRRR